MKTISRLAILVSACLAMTAATVHADPCGDYPLVEESRLGALTTTRSNNTFTRVGDIVYAGGYYQGFQVFDVSDPVQPALLAEVESGYYLLNEEPHVVVSGNVGYVGGIVQEIPVYALGNPAAPVEIARIPVPFEVKALAAAGDRLYVASWGSRTFAGPDTSAFHIFDVSDPTDAVMLTEIWDNHDWAHGMVYRDGVVYLGATQGLHAFDVSDPAAVTELAYLDLGWPVSKMQFEGDRLYGTAGPVLHVFDASAPANLVSLGAVDSGSNSAEGLAVLDGVAVTSHRGSGLRVVEVSDPANPSPVSVWPSTSRCYGLSLEPDRLLVMKQDELMVAARDFPEPYDPLGGIDLVYFSKRLLLSGDLLYTLHGFELLIHDVSDVTAPVQVGKWGDGDAYNTMSRDGDVLYLADLGGGVLALDVSDPAAPRVLSELTTEHASSIHAVGGRVAVGLRYGGVRLFDTSDPAAPVFLGGLVIDSGYRTYGVHLAGDHLYLNTRWTRVLDISDPANIQPVAELLTGYCHDIAADGPWIYTADSDSLKVLRFTAPATLEQVATAPVIGSVEDLHLVGGLLHTAGRDCGVHLFDVTTPPAIQRVGAIPGDRQVYGVSADATRVAVLSRDSYTNPQAIVRFYAAPCLITGVTHPVVPPSVALALDAAPNPFNPRVSFSFALPEAGPVELAVFDLRGRRVATIHDGHLDAGTQRFRWNGLDDTGRPVASGGYVARVRAGGLTAGRSVMLVR